MPTRSWGMNVSSIPAANRNGASAVQSVRVAPLGHSVVAAKRTIVQDIGGSASVKPIPSMSTGRPWLQSGLGRARWRCCRRRDRHRRAAAARRIAAVGSRWQSTRAGRRSVQRAVDEDRRQRGAHRRRTSPRRRAPARRRSGASVAPASRPASATRRRERGVPWRRRGRRSSASTPRRRGSVRIGAMTLTSCAWQAMRTRSAVAQQADEQPADDDGVDDASSRPRSAPAVGRSAASSSPPKRLLVPDVPLVEREGQPPRAIAAGRRRRPPSPRRSSIM